MSAKSAPQLLVHRIRSATLHLQGMLLILALAALTAGAGWLGNESEEFEASDVPVPLTVSPVSESPQPAAAAAVEPRQDNSRFRALSEFLAKRYKVSQAVTLDLVTIAHAAGQQVGLDPLLIIAVMAVESRFNPIAESVAGAKGLMQVIPRYHTDKFREFGGDQYVVFDPETNILVGSQILKEYLARTGSLSSALQLYVGSSSDDDDTYTDKVMTEKQRLQQVLRNKPSNKAGNAAALASEKFVLARQ